MKKFFFLIVPFLFIDVFVCFGMDTPTITATAYGPNQINLTWSGVSNPGWGYKVEIQYVSTTNPDGADTRYTDWTELSWKNEFGFLPYWVTETGGTQSVYTDPTLASSGWGSAVQCPVYGLNYGTTYQFRVRCYGKTDAGVATYGSYSNTDSATTTTPSTIRYVDKAAPGPTHDGTSWNDAWLNIYNAMDVAAGTLVLIKGGNYPTDYIDPNNSGNVGDPVGTGRIFFQANRGETVTITTRNTGHGASSIYITTNFIVIDGLTLAAAAANGNDNPIIITGNRNTITGCSFTGNHLGNYSHVIQCTGSYNMIFSTFASTVGGNQSDGMTIGFNANSADYNTVQNCKLMEGQHDQCIMMWGASYNRIYNNFMDSNGYGMGTEVVSDGINCDYNLVEGNIIKDVALVHHAYKPGFELSGRYATARRNVVYDGWAGATYEAAKGIEVSELASQCTGNLVYNNTVVHNGAVGFVIWGADVTTVQNNVFYDNAVGYTGEGYEYLSDNTATQTINKNYFGNPNSLSVVNRNYSGNQTVDYADANYTEFINNYDRNDLSPIDFIDYNSRELHLKSTSAFRGQGTSVTDSVWGTIDGADLGAFKFYEISGTPSENLLSIGVFFYRSPSFIRHRSKPWFQPAFRFHMSATKKQDRRKIYFQPLFQSRPSPIKRPEGKLNII